MAAPAAVLSVLVTANTSQATRGLIRFNSQLGATQSSANKALGAVKTLAKGAALGAGAGMVYAIKKAADFEQQIDSLGAVSNATGREMERFRKQAMKAGADTKFSALDAAAAQTELAKGGLSVKDIMGGGLKSALALAAAGEMDLAQAAETTANSMNLFGLKGRDAIKVADTLATAANATTADVTDFSMALKQGGSVANTVGLSFKQTVLWLEALAKSGIRNSDAGTSLKTALIQLVKPSEKQATLAKKLGLNFIDSAGNMKDAAAVSEMLRDKLGGMTKAQRTAALATLAGTDGVRTLTALYAAGPEKLDKWEKGLGKSGTAADTAAKKQDNLKGKLENLKGSIETAAIAIGTKWLPTLTKAAEKITNIINDPKLTAGEKFDKLAKMASDAFAAAVPIAAKAAGKMGVAAVRGFFNGFRESPLWAKLLVGGFLFAKMGGFGSFSKVGAQAGGAMATGAANTFGQRMGARMRGIGKNVAGAMLMAGIADAVTRQGISGIGDRFQQGASTATLGILPAPRDIDERMATIAQKIQSWRGSGRLALNRPGDPENSLIRKKDLSDFTAAQRAYMSGMATLKNRATQLFGPGTKLLSSAWSNPGPASRDMKTLEVNFNQLKNRLAGDAKGINATVSQNLQIMGRTMNLSSRQGQQAVAKNMRLAVGAIKDSMASGTTSTKAGMAAIRRSFVVNSKASKETTQRNFKLAAAAIKDAVDSSQITAKEGLRQIAALFRANLKMYGLDAGQRRSYMMTVPKSSGGGGHEATGPNFARGGLMQFGRAGQAGRDTILAKMGATNIKVGPGEVGAVLTRHQQAELNARTADVGGLGGFFRANNKPHYMARGGTIESPQVAGPASPLKSITQKGLDNTTRAANAKLKEAAAAAAAVAASAGGGESSTKGLVPTVKRALAWARAHGWTGSVTDGFRSRAEQQVLYNRYLAGTGNLAARPGASNHERGRAVDITDPAGFRRAMASAPANAKLINLPSEAWHWSVDGRAKGGFVQMAKGGLLAGLNRRFPAHGLGQPGKKLSSRQVRAVAEGWGGLSPARALQADQITVGESTRHPGIIGNDPGGTKGIGLWQITRGVQGALGKRWIDSRGGDAGMRNPKGNAEVMALLSGKGTNWGNWFGTKALRPVQKNVASVFAAGAPRGSGGSSPAPVAKGVKKLLRRVARVKGIGLSKKTEALLKKLTEDAAIFGEYSDRAQSLGAPVNGASEVQWLQAQLSKLFELRNALIRAEQTVVAKREKVAVALAKARKLYRSGKLTRAQKKVYREKLIPALKDAQTRLGTRRGELLSDLETVQGKAAPAGVLKRLPPVGVLGGDIFSVQTRLRELGTSASATDTGTGGSDNEALTELLKQANLRTAVSEKQFEVFKNMPPYGGAFKTGGVVPGPMGMPRTIVAHGGETVAPPGSGDVRVIVNGDIVGTPPGKDPVEVLLGDRRFAAAVERVRMRGPNRPLPGGGGGLRR